MLVFYSVITKYHDADGQPDSVRFTRQNGRDPILISFVSESRHRRKRWAEIHQPV